jgi:hypothetical protein
MMVEHSVDSKAASSVARSAASMAEWKVVRWVEQTAAVKAAMTVESKAAMTVARSAELMAEPKAPTMVARSAET